ncbi:MAG TPA: hypothetical protein VG345_00290 [Bryobacteraceae bacterium]|nr:hypothetical protein [Bryobacteraceae bacterium]
MNRPRAIVAIACLLAGVASADVITLRNGQTVYGTYIGGTARQIRVDVNGQVQTYDIGLVQSIAFNDPGYQPTSSPPPPPPAPQYGNTPSYNAPAPYPPSEPPPPASAAAPSSAGLTIPADTRVTIRMIDSVDSDTARLGQTFRASVDEPLDVNGQIVAPRGADVLTKLVQDEQSGKIQGRTVLTLALVNITINGHRVDVTSTDVTEQSASRGSKSAKVIGGTTALGTIIGALGGGGKGAAIGAVSGAAAGGAVQVLTSGQKVKIPSETRLTFRLQKPVQL